MTRGVGQMKREKQILQEKTSVRLFTRSTHGTWMQLPHSTNQRRDDRPSSQSESTTGDKAAMQTAGISDAHLHPHCRRPVFYTTQSRAPRSHASVSWQQSSTTPAPDTHSCGTSGLLQSTRAFVSVDIYILQFRYFAFQSAAIVVRIWSILLNLLSSTD